ncbi:helix-turn-helix domain-containing protein [Roseomonas sp. 18066]|uniref:helix-turn-helix domain-containing protein n=1 Tax=Roseomonas sp. 18066 TaxID=2681412 RepID=UPI00135C2495|nr:helix-turn-helix domain-containing protein [Roseomonas sp. 18066]
MDEQQRAAKALLERMLAATGLTPSELARAAKLTPSTLTRFLNSPVRHTLSARTLGKLSSYSGVAVPAAVLPAVPAGAVPVVGYIGAGEQVLPFDDAAMGAGLEQVDAPPGAEPGTVAVVVRGSSMFPAFWDGDVLYYARDAGFDRDGCLYNECIVKLRDGPIYIKRVTPGSQPGVYTLQSYNAPPMPDAAIEWAAPVQFQDKRRRRAKS